MIKYSKKEKEFIEKIHLLSGELSLKQCRQFIDSFLTLLILDFQEKSSTYFPFLGDIEISYNGEQLSKKGKQAKININITPDDFLIKNIGQIIDGNETEIEKNLKEDILEIFKGIQSE